MNQAKREGSIGPGHLTTLSNSCRVSLVHITQVHPRDPFLFSLEGGSHTKIEVPQTFKNICVIDLEPLYTCFEPNTF